MHNIDLDLAEMTLDIMKFAVNPITDNYPALGFPKSEAGLKSLVGETITPEGITSEKLLRYFKIF